MNPQRNTPTANPAWMLVSALICAECETEFPLADNGVPMAELDARELADGSICVACAECKRDLAVFHA